VSILVSALVIKSLYYVNGLMHPHRLPAIIESIPMGIPQFSDPSPQYSRNIHTHTCEKPADSMGFPPSLSHAHIYCTQCCR